MKQIWNHNFFTPKIIWGAELNKESCVIVGFKKTISGIEIAHTFNGAYTDAEKFAVQHNLEFKGIAATTSMVPVKISLVGSGSDFSAEEIEKEEDLLLPGGIDREKLLCIDYDENGNRFLIQAREQRVDQILTELPEELGTVTSLMPISLALHHAVIVNKEFTHCATVCVQKEYTLINFYEQTLVHHCIQIPVGIDLFEQNEKRALAELKKVLIYYWETKVLEEPLQQIMLQCENESLTDAISSFGIPVEVLAVKTELQSVPVEMRNAVSATIAETRKDISLGEQNNQVVEDNTTWQNASFTLFKVALIPLLTALLVSLIFITGYGIYGYLYSDAESQFEMELKKIEQVAEKRKDIEKEQDVLQGIMTKNSRVMPQFLAITAALPDEFWFSSWESSPGKGDRIYHTVAGYTTSQKRTSTFLASLEMQESFKSVRLKTTEFIGGKKIQQKTGLKANNRDLIHFTIEAVEK